MSLLGKLFGKDRGREARIELAREQADDARAGLAEARHLGARMRRHEETNHFGDRIAAAYRANDRRGRHA